MYTYICHTPYDTPNKNSVHYGNFFMPAFSSFILIWCVYFQRLFVCSVYFPLQKLLLWFLCDINGVRWSIFIYSYTHMAVIFYIILLTIFFWLVIFRKNYAIEEQKILHVRRIFQFQFCWAKCNNQNTISFVITQSTYST